MFRCDSRVSCRASFLLVGTVKRRIPETVILLPFLGKLSEIPSTNCTQTPETVIFLPFLPKFPHKR